MPSPLRLLILEDRPADAELMLHELRRGGLAVDGQRVETEADFVAALDPALDLILADYSLPQFNALRALQLLQQRGLDIPFIVVTGSVSEEVAVECMKQGAADYLLKDRLTRLGQAVTHALEQQRLRAENRRAAKALRDSEARFRVIFEQANDAIHVSNAADEILEVNPRLCALMGYTRDELVRMHVADLQAPEVRGLPGQVITHELAEHGSTTFESLNLHRSGRSTPVEISVARVESEQGDLYVSIVRDITERKQAELALRASEQKYRRLHESMIDGFCYVDMEGRILDSNPSYQQMLGYTFEELTQLTYRDLTPAPWHPMEQAIVDEQILPRGYSDIYQKEYRRKDGTVLPIEIHTFLIKNDAGENEGMWAIVRDITERKQAEDALVQERLLLRTVIDNLPDAVYAKDRQGRKILVNRADLDQIGKPENAVLGKTDAEIFPPHIAAQFEADDQSVLQTGQAVLNHEELVINEQGRQFWQRTSKLPLKDAAGRIVGLVGIGHDFTERKQAEEARRQTEKHFRSLIENAPDGIVLIAPDNTFKYVSPSARRIFGYSAEAALNLDPLEATHPADRPLVAAALNDLLQDPAQVPTLQYRFQSQDGSWLWIESTFSNLLADSSVEAIVINFRDITERRQAEAAIHESERRERERATELQTIMDTVPAAVWIVHDQLSQVITGNRAAYQLVRLPPGSNASRSVPEDQRLAHTKIYQNGIELPPNDLPLQISAATGVEIRDFEQELVFDDGTIVHELGNVMPLFDEQGCPRGAVGAFIDITERKQAEERLRNAERFAHATIDALSAHLCVLDEDGVILTVNQAWHDFAQANPPVPSSHFLGAKYLQVCDDAEGRDEAGSAAFAAGLRAVMRGDMNQFDLEYPCHAPWEERWFMARVTRFSGEGLLRVVVAHEDITARKQLEARLHDKVAALQTLAEIDQEITAATESQTILELVCRRAAELVHAPKSALLSRIAEKMSLTASYGLRDAALVGAEFLRAQQAGLMSFPVLQTRQSYVLNDITADNPFMRETVQGEEVQALAIVALSAGQEPIGALTVFDTVPRQWQADELQILALLAGQTAIALEKVRLFEADRQRAAQLAMLNEIGQAITSTLDLDLMLVTLLEKVRRATMAEASSVALIEKESGDLVFRQAMGGAVQAIVGLRLPPGEGVVGWVAEHRKSVKLDEAALDMRHHVLHNTAGFVTRSLVCVPLIVRDTVTGVLELVNSQHGHFSQDDVQLLESVAAQAAIVIENARLFEMEHSARKQLETLYRIGQAINSTLEADAILERLTDEAVQATQATQGSALVAHPGQGVFERVSLRGYSPEQAEAARRDALPLDRGLNGRAYRLQQPVYIDDVTTDPEYHPLIPTTRSELAVPIVRSGQVIGNLDLQSPVVNAFHAVDLQYLQALTDQVAIALENARLFEETRRHMDELTIVSQVALVGAAGRPFDETVARATDALSRLWPEAALGFLFVDETGLALRRHTSYVNSVPECDPLEGISFDRGLTGWAARQQRPIRVGDVTTDPRYFQKISNIRSEMVAPLVVGTQLIGVVNVETPQPDAFSGDDLRLLTTLAGQLAVVFEKARLDAAVIEHTAHLEQRVQERTAEIRREQARTQAILDALGEGVVVTDLQGTIQYLNQAMELVTGFSINESLGQNPRLWQSGQTPLEVYEAMWSTVLGGQTWHGEIVNRRKDGEPYFASLTVAPIPMTANSSEPFAGIVGIQRDITERKRAQEEVQRALEKERELNNIKSNFVSLTSHEFRTPLTTILSSAEMLEHYAIRWTEERKQEHLQRIQTSVKYMTSLLDDVLVVAKAEANRLEFAPAPLDLLKFCHGLTEEFELMDKGKHRLQFDGEMDCAQVHMDEQSLTTHF